ncbi:hypothetical protein CI109_105486 [Kwoniella shandongensis]|uniref:Uncharacterized protein n=1 Tax=Kwoniella shandongensis TaxID=1734106 RepID=A0AAJ8MXE9_9TREE
MDFASISGKGSMRRKSLLHVLGKQPSSSSSTNSYPHSHRQSSIPVSNPNPFPHSAPSSTYSTPQTATLANFPDEGVYSPTSTAVEYDSISFASTSRTVSQSSHPHHGHGHGHSYGGHGHGGRSASANYLLGGGGGDSKSISTTIGPGSSSGSGVGGQSGSAATGAVGLKRPEDLFRVVRERMLSWSYMMEWYQGDTHWLNTVRIPRSTIEQTLGAKHLESRARNFYILGISLSAMFDIPSASDYLKALIKLLDEWESWAEGSGGGKGVKNLFRGQKSARKMTGTGSMISDFAAGGFDGSESYLLNVNMPFVPDFFQVHSSACSIIRDIYKKLLGMFLPLPSISSIPQSSTLVPGSLIHPSTIIHSAPLETPFTAISNPKSPGASSLSTATFPTTGYGVLSPTNGSVIDNLGGGAGAGGGGYDALQALIAGDLPSDRTLVGDGQKLTPQVVELFLKVDTKLKKHFSILIREGDTLARKVLDDELGLLLNSLNPGSKPLSFDTTAATTGSNAATGGGGGGTGYGTVNVGRLGKLEEEERKERDFGTI